MKKRSILTSSILFSLLIFALLYGIYENGLQSFDNPKIITLRREFEEEFDLIQYPSHTQRLERTEHIFRNQFRISDDYISEKSVEEIIGYYIFAMQSNGWKVTSKTPSGVHKQIFFLRGNQNGLLAFDNTKSDQITHYSLTLSDYISGGRIK